MKCVNVECWSDMPAHCFRKREPRQQLKSIFTNCSKSSGIGWHGESQQVITENTGVQMAVYYYSTLLLLYIYREKETVGYFSERNMIPITSSDMRNLLFVYIR